MTDVFDQLQPRQKPKVGRPSIYSDELADRIIELLYEGYSLRSIAAMDGLPSAITITRWRAVNPVFRSLYEEARQLQLDLMADELLDIVDGAAQNVPHGRLRMDARKWLLSKLARHVYGTTVKIEQEKPQEPETDYSKLTDAELATVLALLEKAKRDEDAD